MRVSATAPCRVDLAGATLDIWPLYLFHDRVVTVNFAVDIHARCDIATRAVPASSCGHAILGGKRVSSRSIC